MKSYFFLSQLNLLCALASAQWLQPLNFDLMKFWKWKFGRKSSEEYEKQESQAFSSSACAYITLSIFWLWLGRTVHICSIFSLILFVSCVIYTYSKYWFQYCKTSFVLHISKELYWNALHCIICIYIIWKKYMFLHIRHISFHSDYYYPSLHIYLHRIFNIHSTITHEIVVSMTLRIRNLNAKCSWKSLKRFYIRASHEQAHSFV